MPCIHKERRRCVLIAPLSPAIRNPKECGTTTSKASACRLSFIAKYSISRRFAADPGPLSFSLSNLTSPVFLEVRGQRMSRSSQYLLPTLYMWSIGNTGSGGIIGLLAFQYTAPLAT